MRLIDSHCHLADARFTDGLADVIERSRKAGVTRWVVSSACSGEWDRLLELADAHAGLHPALGIHPWYCDRHRDLHLRRLRQLLSRAVALGECGLDFGAGRPDPAVQEHWLEQQLLLAEGLGLPVILHTHKSLDRLIQMLKRHPGIRGVVHGFAGSLVQASRLIDLGMYLGFGTLLLKSERIRKVAAGLPLETLLLESDAPDQSLDKGRLNEPAVLPRVLDEMARIRRLPALELAARCNANAARLFAIGSEDA